MASAAGLSGAGAIRAALAAELEADPSVVLLGEEVASGGLFGATDGLAARFGGRVIEIAHDEATLVGAAIGMALAGYRPVVELLLADHLAPAFQQVAGELANLRHATGGELFAPVVLRLPAGRGTGAGPRQSLVPEALLANVPGLVIVQPAGPAEAYALLRAAIRCDDPVVFIESVELYAGRAGADAANGAGELGRGRVARAGGDVSVFAWGRTVGVALAAAERAAGDGIEVEVVDLQTLVPLDQALVLDSAARTGRAIVVHDAPRTGGLGAEVAAVIGEGALEYLVAPVLRIGAPDAPAAWRAGEAALVGAEQVYQAILATVDGWT